MERYMWGPASSTQQNNLSSRRHTSDMKSGVHEFTSMYTKSPNMESPSSNNNILIENSQLTDNDGNIGEWLANEEATLNELPSNYYQEQINDPMFHENLEFQYNRRADNNRDELLMPNKVSYPVARGTELRATSEIPTPFNSIFKFGVFNVIQSQCLDDAFYESNNLVISAPTGSGKTVLMELAIIRTILQNGDNCKIIYMAPTKSLCSERMKDWGDKFKPFGIECKEFTGDTHFVSMASIRKAGIIITTPEKWDAMTRRKIDNKSFMQLASLFLIDEVHILNEKRGACLEACVSRMQTAGHHLRYIAVSATVPNLQDIAIWLKAKPLSFSEDYRPIKLERFVYGYPNSEPNMFLFDRKLDWKLLDLIQKHSNSKPVLIFCSTRKSVEQSCNTILDMMNKKRISSLSEGGNRVTPGCKFKNKLLPKFVERGIAFHHAGLDPSDRSHLENLFSNRDIRVITTTSTLAVGVNLPAHLVIIKSTQGYQEGGLKEYSDLDLLQMIGRAGRPGLDTSGTTVIMTTLSMEGRYKSLSSGITNIESRLHENLIEHLMSEICLGTIIDIPTALNWLRSTFLYVRVSKNPMHYKLDSALYTSTDNILQEICVKDLELLKEHNLVEETSSKTLKATEYGLAMDRYYIKYRTMVRLIESEDPKSVKDTLSLLSESQEDMETVRFNSGEKPFLNALASNPNIRFPIEKVMTIPQKIFILIQCLLGDISLYNSGNNLLAIEASSILTAISRITRCVIDCSIYEKNPIRLKFAVELYQSLQAKIWSTSPYVARQIEGIGQQLAKTLAQANMISIDQLRNCDPGRIEMILKRNPPFGTKIKKHLDAIPHFILNVEQSPCPNNNRRKNSNEFINLHVTLALANTAVIRGRYGKAYHAQFSVDTSDKTLLDFRRILISKLHEGQQEFDLKVEVMSPTTIIYCNLRSEDFVGIDVIEEIKPNVDPKNYISLAASSFTSAQTDKEPQQDTRPTENKTIEQDYSLEEFEIDPRIWAEIDSLSLSSKASTPKPAVNSPISKPAAAIAPIRKPTVATSPTNFEGPSNTKPNPQNSQKKPVSRRKKNPDELCRHRCRNKELCSHACCKLHISSTSADTKSGIKRVFDEDDDPILESLLQKKSKTSTSEERSYNETNSYVNNNTIPFNYARSPINATEFGSIENDHLISNKETQKNQVSDNDISFMDFSDFNEQDIESINKFDINFPLTETNDMYQYEIEGNFPIITDINGNGAFSDPCDLLWQQAGEYVQKVFEQTPSISTNESNGVLRDMESIENTNYTVNNPSFQSSSLADWVQNYVEILYDEPTQWHI